MSKAQLGKKHKEHIWEKGEEKSEEEVARVKGRRGMTRREQRRGGKEREQTQDGPRRGLGMAQDGPRMP